MKALLWPIMYGRRLGRIQSSRSGLFGCLRLLALLSEVVINTGVISLCILISLPLAVCPGMGFFFEGGSYVSSIFKVLNSLHTVLHRDYANLQCPPQQLGFCFLFILANTCHLLDSYLDEGGECMYLGCSLLRVSNTGPSVTRHSKIVEWRNNFLDLSLGWDKMKCTACYIVPAVRRANSPSGFSSPLCPISLVKSPTAYWIIATVNWLCSCKSWVRKQISKSDYD